MAQEENSFTYTRVSVEPEHELAMIKLLMNSGQKFSAVSITDYLISNKQCNELTKNKIPYKKF